MKKSGVNISGDSHQPTAGCGHETKYVDCGTGLMGSTKADGSGGGNRRTDVTLAQSGSAKGVNIRGGGPTSRA